MMAEIAGQVGIIVAAFDPAAPRTTADGLRDLWLQFEPKSMGGIKAEQREQQEQQNQQQAEATKTQEETERDLANEQWLRRIPDDPAGLLRRKFRYESQQRSEERRDSNENSW